MVNGTFLAVAVLLEQQTERLDGQARLRERAKAAAVEMGRRAQLAQAEARQAALNASSSKRAAAAAGSGGSGGEGGDAARAVAVRAAEAARAASQDSEAAVAEARRLAAEKGAEQWLGADALATLVTALIECRIAMEGGAAWTAAAAGGGGGVHPNDGGGGGGGDASASSSPLQVAQRTCKAIMMQVGVLSEEELKKESPDVRT